MAEINWTIRTASFDFVFRNYIDFRRHDANLNFKLCYSLNIAQSLQISDIFQPPIPQIDSTSRIKIKIKAKRKNQLQPLKVSNWTQTSSIWDAFKRHFIIAFIARTKMQPTPACTRTFSLDFSNAADETSWQPTIRLNFATVVKTIFIVISRLLNFRFDKIPFLLPNLPLFTGQRERLRWNIHQPAAAGPFYLKSILFNTQFSSGGELFGSNQ